MRIYIVYDILCYVLMQDGLVPPLDPQEASGIITGSEQILKEYALYVCPVENVLGRVPLMPCYLKGNLHNTIPHALRYEVPKAQLQIPG